MHAVVRDLGLEAQAFAWSGPASGIGDESRLLADAWDLADVEDRYLGVPRRLRVPRAPTRPADAFVAQVEMVQEWRRFPFLDPDLPGELLDHDWPGPRAAAAFHDRHAAWHRRGAGRVGPDGRGGRPPSLLHLTCAPSGRLCPGRLPFPLSGWDVSPWPFSLAATSFTERPEHGGSPPSRRRRPTARPVTRLVIEHAKGALMLRYGIDSHQAFAVLLSWARATQHPGADRRAHVGARHLRGQPADRAVQGPLMRWLESRLRLNDP